MQRRNTQPRHLDNVDAPPSLVSSGRCSCRITGAEQGRLVRVSILGLSNGGARPPEAAHPPPTPPLGPVVLRQSRQESGGELGQLKKARRGGAKAGALHPARGRLRLAPPLTALWLLRRRSMSFASGVGCSLASSPVGHRPSASPHADHSRARRRRRASPRRHACLLTREPIEGVRAGGALRRRRSSDRARSGRCSAPPLRAPAAASAATPDAPPFPSPVRLPRVMWQCARAARPGVCMAPIPIPVRTRSSDRCSAPPSRASAAASAAPAATAAAPTPSPVRLVRTSESNSSVIVCVAGADNARTAQAQVFVHGADPHLCPHCYLCSLFTKGHQPCVLAPIMT